MRNELAYKKYCRKYLSYFKSSEKPIVWQLWQGRFTGTDPAFISELLDMLCIPIDFSGMTPDMFICSEATFLIVKLKYPEMVVQSWTKQQFLYIIRKAYGERMEGMTYNFNPLRSLSVVLAKSWFGGAPK